MRKRLIPTIQIVDDIFLPSGEIPQGCYNAATQEIKILRGSNVLYMVCHELIHHVINLLGGSVLTHNRYDSIWNRCFGEPKVMYRTHRVIDINFTPMFLTSRTRVYRDGKLVGWVHRLDTSTKRAVLVNDQLDEHEFDVQKFEFVAENKETVEKLKLMLPRDLHHYIVIGTDGSEGESHDQAEGESHDQAEGESHDQAEGESHDQTEGEKTFCAVWHGV